MHWLLLLFSQLVFAFFTSVLLCTFMVTWQFMLQQFQSPWPKLLGKFSGTPWRQCALSTCRRKLLVKCVNLFVGRRAQCARLFKWLCSHLIPDIGVRAIFCQGGGSPFAQKILASCPNFYKTVDRKVEPCNKVGRTGIWKWLETVFQSQYLPNLSINYVATNKHLEKIATTVVLDKEGNLSWSGLQWHRSCHSNEMTPLPIILAAIFLTGNCS